MTWHFMWVRASGWRFAALRGVVAWRDTVARQQDESSGFVLPDVSCCLLARKPPSTVDALFRSLNPVPQHVRDQAHEVPEKKKRRRRKRLAK